MWFQPTKKRRGGSAFIEAEADLSDGDDCSSDDTDGSSLDEMDDSFIYDQSQCSQQDPNGKWLFTVFLAEGAGGSNIYCCCC